MWLQTIDNMVVTFDQHHQLARLDRPEEDVATITAAHHIVIAPKGGLLDLQKDLFRAS